MRSTNALPAKGPSLTCGACGLKSYAPVVIECVKLKGEKTARIRCADTTVACGIRLRRAGRLIERSAARHAK